MTDERAYAPHCDSTILHKPGKCVYCDEFPEYQRYREIAQIAFSGEPDQSGVKRVYPTDRGSMTRLEDYVAGISPCPSTWFRDPSRRDQWGGNRAYTQAEIDADTAARREAHEQWISDQEWDQANREMSSAGRRNHLAGIPWRWRDLLRGRRGAR